MEMPWGGTLQGRLGEWSGALLQRESGAYYLASGVTLISLRKEDVQTELDKLNGE